MPHGTLTRDQNQHVTCALPAGLRQMARIVACRFPNAPWRIAVLGRRPPQRLTLDDNQQLTAHVPITGFVKPIRDDRPSLHFKPSIVAGRLVLPPDHRAKPGDDVKAHHMDEAGSWQTTTVTVGDLVPTPADAPYRVHETGPPTKTEPIAAPQEPKRPRATAPPPTGTPTQPALFKS